MIAENYDVLVLEVRIKQIWREKFLQQSGKQWHSICRRRPGKIEKRVGYEGLERRHVH